MMRVTVPLADLRTQPQTAAQPGLHDPHEETQLLYGERVRVTKRLNGWARVEALEQPEFTHARRWQGYPGWIPDSILVPWDQLMAPTVIVTAAWAQAWHDPYLTRSTPWRFGFGTRLRATDMAGERWKVELHNDDTVWLRFQDARSLEELAARSPLERRQTVIRSAELLVGDPYYWGGRSPSWGLTPKGSDPVVTGVDCSGLVNLAYRSAGVEIPRDAHEQFLRAKRVPALQPADLVFLSERADPARIVHVMLYAGEGEVIEGPGTGLTVRRIALSQRLGRPIDQLSPGAVIDGQTVFFGSYLP
jgi:hypothetical protein